MQQKVALDRQADLVRRVERNRWAREAYLAKQPESDVPIPSQPRLRRLATAVRTGLPG